MGVLCRSLQGNLAHRVCVWVYCVGPCKVTSQSVCVGVLCRSLQGNLIECVCGCIV